MLLWLTLRFTGESDGFRQVDRKMMQNRVTEQVCS